MPEDQKSQEFLEAYRKIREEFKRDFISIPQFVPNEKGLWDVKVVVQVVSIEDQPVPTNFVS